jgi:hypothetical protein
LIGVTTIAASAIEKLRQTDKRLAEQRRQIREALKGQGAPLKDPDEERARQRKAKREATAAVKDVQIPPTPKKNKRRRRRYEKDDAAWLRYYFGKNSNCPDPFWYRFTSQQEEMIAAIRHAILYGGDQAIASNTHCKA